jgi:hypothetical protein
MGQIFISYSNKNRAIIEKLATILQGNGWTVWYDHRVEAGESFDRAIEAALDAAECVLVLWTNDSVNSRWVRAEAAEALDRNILIPIKLQEVKPPLQFRHIQHIDLVGWVGNAKDARLGLLITALRNRPLSNMILPPPAGKFASESKQSVERVARVATPLAKKLRNLLLGNPESEASLDRVPAPQLTPPPIAPHAISLLSRPPSVEVLETPDYGAVNRPPANRKLPNPRDHTDRFRFKIRGAEFEKTLALSLFYPAGFSRNKKFFYNFGSEKGKLVFGQDVSLPLQVLGATIVADIKFENGGSRLKRVGFTTNGKQFFEWPAK